MAGLRLSRPRVLSAPGTGARGRSPRLRAPHAITAAEARRRDIVRGVIGGIVGAGLAIVGTWCLRILLTAGQGVPQ